MHSGETPGKILQRAVQDGQIDTVREVLLNPDLDINAPCDPEAYEPLSPLMIALRAADPHMVALILQQPGLGFALSLPQYETWTWVSSASLEVLHLFLSHPEADINQQDGNGKGLLHEVVADQGGLEKLSYLLGQSGCTVDLKRNDGTTPLYQAALHGNLEAVAALLQYPVDVNNRNSDNLWTVLMIAVADDHAAIARLLLRHPEIDPNAQSDSGETALHIASERGHALCVALLLEHSGIDVNRKDASGRTALAKAAFQNRLDILRMLCARPDLEVNFVDRNRQTALHWAVMAGHLEAVELLLERSDISVGITNRPAKQTASDLAESLGYQQILRLLLERAGSGNATDTLSPNDAYQPRQAEIASREPAQPFIADPPIR